jgi:hypothetical protein
MKTLMVGAVLAILVGSAGGAQAQLQKMVSPPIFGSHDQNQATCVVRNTGMSTLALQA